MKNKTKNHLPDIENQKLKSLSEQIKSLDLSKQKNQKWLVKWSEEIVAVRNGEKIKM
jgi:hypothetical protein